MNIYELEKKATPGPLVVAEPCPSFRDSISIQITAPCSTNDQNKRHVACLIRDTESEAINDAALLAHCRNHFMEALEALKDEHYQWYTETEQRYGSHDESTCAVCLLIDKLETVEAP